MWWMLCIAIGVVLTDQITKIYLGHYLQHLTDSTLPVWKNVFHLTYVENKGAAFGIFQNSRWIFILFTIVIIIGIVIYTFKNYEKMNNILRVSLALIVGGAIGNLINRILTGYVVDLFDFKIIQFPVFNVADSCVCIGTLGVIIYLFFSKEKTGILMAI
jgi:signal peptidase II